MGLAGLARWKTKSTGSVDVDVLGDVDVAELEPVVAEVLDVLERARVEVVEADDPVALAQQVLAQVRAEEPGAAGHDRCGHVAPPQYAPRVRSTAPSVRHMMYASLLSDHVSMYCRSSATMSSNERSLRPLTCQRPVMPGCIT